MTTCLSLVLVTTILFGSTIGLISDCLFSKEDHSHSMDETQIDGIDVDNVDDAASEGSTSSSNFSELQHPNRAPLAPSVNSGSALASGVMNDNYQRAESASHVENSVNQQAKRETMKLKKKKGCFSYIERFDEFCMKPIFIHRYNKAKQLEADDFANDFC